MKFLKYVLFCFWIMIFPNLVNALEQTVDYKEFNIGDEIEVTLNENGLKGKFRVIEASEAHRDLKVEGQPVKDTTKDYQFVTAIYEGTIGESVYTNTPSEKVAFKDSNLYSNLIIATKDLKWDNIEEVRLMNKADMIRLFNMDPGSERVITTYPWLVLDRTYWFEDDGQTMTSYVDCGDEEVTPECTKIKYVARAMNRLGTYMYYEQENTASIRPVIKIHKAFIEGGMICTCEDCEEKKLCPNDSSISIQFCLDGGTKEEECIKKLCPGTKKVENPKTGTYISYGILLVIVSLGIVYFIANRRKYFSKL